MYIVRDACARDMHWFSFEFPIKRCITRQRKFQDLTPAIQIVRLGQRINEMRINEDLLRRIKDANLILVGSDIDAAFPADARIAHGKKRRRKEIPIDIAQEKIARQRRQILRDAAAEANNPPILAYAELLEEGNEVQNRIHVLLLFHGIDEEDAPPFDSLKSRFIEPVDVPIQNIGKLAFQRIQCLTEIIHKGNAVIVQARMNLQLLHSIILSFSR